MDTKAGAPAPLGNEQIVGLSRRVEQLEASARTWRRAGLLLPALGRYVMGLGLLGCTVWWVYRITEHVFGGTPTTDVVTAISWPRALFTAASSGLAFGALRLVDRLLTPVETLAEVEKARAAKGGEVSATALGAIADAAVKMTDGAKKLVEAAAAARKDG